jgi:hypothetical protein
MPRLWLHEGGMDVSTELVNPYITSAMALSRCEVCGKPATMLHIDVIDVTKPDEECNRYETSGQPFGRCDSHVLPYRPHDWRCSRCGHVNVDGHSICDQCGSGRHGG